MPPRTLTIHTVLNGWVIQAGCQLLAYSDRDKLLTDFADFTRDPEGTERRLVMSACNRKTTLGLPPQAPPPIAEEPRGIQYDATAAGMAAIPPAPPVAIHTRGDLLDTLARR